MMLSHVEMIARIASGAALGAIIGYERDIHRRPVGLRTHLLVAMTSATFMVISSQFVFWQGYRPGDLVEVDASRIAASVVSAVGFLAGGAILRTGLTVQGLTTAAGLWLVTAIGMCTGAGMFVEGVVVTALGIGALTVLRRFEDKTHFRRRITVVLDAKVSGTGAVTAILESLGIRIADVEYERRFDEEKSKLVATYYVEIAEKLEMPKLIAALEAAEGVRRVQIQAHL